MLKKWSYKGESVPWDEVKDKPMKILLNLKTAIEFLKGLGANIEEIDGIYWIKINYKKKSNKVNIKEK